MALIVSILYFSIEICHVLFHILLKALCKRTMCNRNPFLVEWKDISATSIFLSLACQSDYQARRGEIKSTALTRYDLHSR